MPEANKCFDDIKVIYYIDDQETPYLTKLSNRSSNENITLSDLKNALGQKRFQNYRFFFKSIDADIGEVKEEITGKNSVLPCIEGKIVTWLVPTGDDGATHFGESSSSSSGPGSIQSAPLHPKEQHKSLNRSASAMIPGEHRRLNISQRPDSVVDSSHVNLEDSLDESADTDSTIGPSNDVACRTNSRSQPSGRRAYNSSVDSSCLYSDSCTLDTEQERYAVVNDKRRRRCKRFNPTFSRLERQTAMSTCTDSTLSLNFITVTLNLDNVNFLGISIVGQGSNGGRTGRGSNVNGGIYVGAVMKGGAVALDGRIEAGDMILQVNDISFENLSNDEAVKVLRNAVQNPGPIKLVVAKGWNSNPAGYFSLNRRQSVHPIDPSLWVAQTAAAMGKCNQSCREQRSLSSTTSSTAKLYSSNRFIEGLASTSDLNLTVHTDMEAVTHAMAASDSGLDVRDRMWLKIRIPEAFLGCDLVNWLLSHVDGFTDRRDARKYASNMLRSGYIRATVNKANFSEQCYYVFGDICRDMSRLAIDNEDGTSFNDDSTLVSDIHRPINFPETHFRKPMLELEANPVSDATLVEHDDFHFPTTPTIRSESDHRFQYFAKSCDSTDRMSDGESNFTSFEENSHPYHSTAVNSPTSRRCARPS